MRPDTPDKPHQLGVLSSIRNNPLELTFIGYEIIRTRRSTPDSEKSSMNFQKTSSVMESGRRVTATRGFGINQSTEDDRENGSAADSYMSLASVSEIIGHYFG